MFGEFSRTQGSMWLEVQFTSKLFGVSLCLCLESVLKLVRHPPYVSSCLHTAS
ncbi:hypothetical protein LOKVESSMR4R_04001 (plasmid) [Yoonia vestfoldensis]|uniref:Uncharacterized protein n=1 Tax=Yoonia vestfoldensis TaxID=245188 RepID=A0A1Y0EIH3_9RHOB|nr:hypothetical protein LOKVESSMR4R_04001 [Yoonia vestfoldensis]